MPAMSDYLENKLVDRIFRGQAFTFPSQLYIGLLTSAPSDSSSGVEVSGGSYARVVTTCALTTWSGTQSAGSTTASSGASGTTSNNSPITFQAPSSNWGTVTHFAIYDSNIGGNLMFWGELNAPKIINNGDSAPAFLSGALSVQLDN